MSKIKNAVTEFLGMVVIAVLLATAFVAAWAYDDAQTTESQSVIQARDNVRALMDADAHP